MGHRARFSYRYKQKRRALIELLKAFPVEITGRRPVAEAIITSGGVKCGEIEYNADGTVNTIHVTADLESGNGNPVDGRKIKGTIHWLSSDYAQTANVMLYDHLFTLENIDDMPEGKTYNDYLNPESAIKLEGCMIEPALAEAEAGDRFQFVRNGYYVKDTKNANTFNRIVGLKDSFPKK